LLGPDRRHLFGVERSNKLRERYGGSYRQW